MNENLSSDRFVTVTELAGTEVSKEQVSRLCERYYWAADRSRGKDVLEVACGTGAGLGHLAKHAKSVSAGDISEAILNQPRAHYGARVDLKQFGAEAIPYPDRSKDVILLFEAIYYLTNVDAFLEECRRVLRPGGSLLIVTANKDIFAFNPSPFSTRYLGVIELGEALENHGFSAKFSGAYPVKEAGLRQRILQPVKKIVVDFGLMPKTMEGKKLLKRLVFGSLVKLPTEIQEGMTSPPSLTALSPDRPDSGHKVIFCEATLRKDA